MAWLRWDDHCTSDPKWGLIADEAEVSVAEVVSLWAAVLEDACQRREGGRFCIDPAVTGRLLGMKKDRVSLVLHYMQGRVVDGDKIINWTRYQEPSTERVRRHRAKRNETA
jgi:hypothetical protein